jgi:hypothetical protein
MTQRRHISLLLVAAVAAGGLAGCSFREAICRSGEYPVAAVDSTTGRACVADGEEPPAGYVRFPAGKVPEHVGDEWDRYWGEHELDEHGKEVPRSPGGTGAPVPHQPLMP